MLLDKVSAHQRWYIQSDTSLPAASERVCVRVADWRGRWASVYTLVWTNTDTDKRLKVHAAVIQCLLYHIHTGIVENNNMQLEMQQNKGFQRRDESWLSQFLSHTPHSQHCRSTISQHKPQLGSDLIHLPVPLTDRLSWRRHIQHKDYDRSPLKATTATLLLRLVLFSETVKMYSNMMREKQKHLQVKPKSQSKWFLGKSAIHFETILFG